MVSRELRMDYMDYILLYEIITMSGKFWLVYGFGGLPH